MSTPEVTQQTLLKRQAAAKALELVQSGMTLGLGTGSTAREFVDLLGEKFKNGEIRDIACIATSVATQEQAAALGLPLITFGSMERLNLVVDGADEVDSHMNLVKGLGKALLREKIVEIHAEQLVIMVDESKVVQKLGTKCPLPVEVTKFGIEAHLKWLAVTLGCKAEWWLDDGTTGGVAQGATGQAAVTDNGNYLVKCHFPGGIDNPYALAKKLDERPGIVEHGLFLDMATTLIVAGAAGVQVVKK